MEQKNMLQKRGADLIVCLHSLSSVLRLYEDNNQAVVRQIELLKQILDSLFSKGSALRLTLREEEFFVNNQLLKVDVQLYKRAKELSVILGELKFNDIHFSIETTKQDVYKFVSDFSKGIKKQKDIFIGKQYGGISGKKAQGSSSAAFRFEPERLAVWLYAGLLEVTEQLFTVYEKGEAPSLLPIRRSLQMIIDNMKNFGGMYQMLCAFRSPQEERKRVQLRAAIAIDSIGFSLFLGRSNSEVLEIALAGLLAGLTDSHDPNEATKILFRFGGLGETALGLVVCIHDAKAGRQGKNISLYGQILLVVEEYYLRMNQNRKMPLPKLIYQLLHETSFKTPLLQLFARYKGPFPIGSFILVDDELMLVVGQKNAKESKKRPIVMRIVQRRLVETIDLSKDSFRHITQISSLSEQAFVLEDLVL